MPNATTPSIIVTIFITIIIIIVVVYCPRPLPSHSDPTLYSFDPSPRGNYTLLTYLPKFLKEVLEFDMRKGAGVVRGYIKIV
jgi:hypothetical protein